MHLNAIWLTLFPALAPLAAPVDKAGQIPVYVWILFNIFIILLLALDLGVFQRHAHVIKIKEALILSAFWIALALLFNLFILLWLGPKPALEYLTGYLIEKSLSVDNLFVFLLIFTYFRVPRQYQHKILFWGILGALVMRFAFIMAGATLINRFHWTIYILGVFLVFTGIRMALRREEADVHPEKNPVLKLFRRLMPVTKRYQGSHFIRRAAGRTLATPLLVVLIVIETTDVMFAVDSVPAILAITLHTFIVYSSNVFAILGLRALFFALAGIMELFHYLHYGLSFILVFIGIKMLVSGFFKIPTGWALAVVALVLSVSILASILFPEKEKKGARRER